MYAPPIQRYILKPTTRPCSRPTTLRKCQHQHALSQKSVYFFGGWGEGGEDTEKELLWVGKIRRNPGDRNAQGGYGMLSLLQIPNATLYLSNIFIYKGQEFFHCLLDLQGLSGEEGEWEVWGENMGTHIQAQVQVQHILVGLTTSSRKVLTWRASAISFCMVSMSSRTCPTCVAGGRQKLINSSSLHRNPLSCHDVACHCPQHPLQPLTFLMQVPEGQQILQHIGQAAGYGVPVLH